MGAVIPITKDLIQKPYHSVGNNPDVLTDIYNDNINIAIYKREVSDEIDGYVHELLALGNTFAIVQIVENKNIKQLLNRTLPDFVNKDAFIEDVYQVCDMFSVLFDLEKLGLRLTVLEHAMCPRFHVDNIPCRLLTTYGNTGTEWLSEDNLDRNKLGRGNNGLPDEKSGVFSDQNNINIIEKSDIALLKGESGQIITIVV